MNVLLADVEHRSSKASMRSARLGRFVPFLASCVRQECPKTPAKVFDPDLFETYIAQCPDAVSTTDGMDPDGGTHAVVRVMIDEVGLIDLRRPEGMLQ